MRSNRLEQIGLYTDYWRTDSSLVLESKSEMGIREMEQWLREGVTNFPPEYVEKLRSEINEPGKASEFKARLQFLLGEGTNDEEQ